MLMDCASCFDDNYLERSMAGRHSSWPIAEALRKICAALREALACQRKYERLRSRGVPHERALREALGVGHLPCECRAADRTPLKFQGNTIRLGAPASIGNLSYVR